MSSELRLSQFRYVVTNNNDFVIGDPFDTSNSPRVLTFQVNNTPGYNSNPHIRAEWITDHWELRWSHNGTTLSGFAMLNSPNTFEDVNTFNGSVNLGNSSLDSLTVDATSTFNSPVIINSDFTVNGNTSYLHVTNVSTSDKAILLNRGGIASSATLAGFEIEEGGTVTSYVRTNTGRTGFDFKAPSSSGVITLLPATAAASLNLISTSTLTRTQYFPDKDGTLATTADVAGIISGFTTNRALTSNALGTITASSVTSTELGYLSGVTSSVQSQFNGKANLTGAAFTGPISGTTATFSTFTGDLRGSLVGRNLPATSPGAGEDGYVIKYNSATTSWIWASVGTNFVTTDTVQTITAAKTFTGGVSLGYSGGFGTATGTHSITKTSANDITYNLNILSGGYDLSFLKTAGNQGILQVSGGSAGAVLRLKDVSNGSNYKLYFNNGVLTQAAG